MENNKFPPPEPEDAMAQGRQDIPDPEASPEEVIVTELFPEEAVSPDLPPEENTAEQIPLDEMPEVEELFFSDLPVPEEEAVPREVPAEDLTPASAQFDAPETAPVEPTAPVWQEDQETEIPTAAEITEDSEGLPEDEEFFEDLFVEDQVSVSPEISLTTEETVPSDSISLEDPQITLPEAPEPEEEFLDQQYRDEGQEFEKLFKSSPAKPSKKTQETTVFSHKGRPKRKKGEGLLGIPSILATFVWLALIVLIGVTAGRMLWLCAADVLAFGREDKVVTVTVYEADTMEDIIDKLHEQGLIRYKSLFSLYADISEAEEDIKPGIYDLNTRYDYHALVNFMSPRSSREVIQLTIPEGYTCRQIFSLLEENRICTAVDAASYAANGELSDYWFLDGVQRGTDNCLEGYLFPDTYEFYKNSTPREALERMLDNFEYRFNEELMEQIEDINDQFGCDYTVREIVIIASLIEKESAAPGESPMVSGVIYNRLFDWGDNPPYLNIDASIVYAQDGENEKIDTSLDSPYNTYAYEGLTPGPIANPGLSSLKAALNPEDHNYYYYVLNPSTGMHQFSTTYEEHTGYVRQFAEATEGQ